jgi:hypothetical protein
MLDCEQIKGVRVLKFKKKLKNTVLQRYLVSKFLYDTINFELKDLAALFLNQLALEDLFNKGKEENSIKDWKEDLSKLSQLLKEFDFSNNLSKRGIENFGKRLVASKFTKLVCPKRNFENLKSQIDPYFSFDEVKNPIPKPEPKEPKSYIGKGYTDKGNKKNPATHGSPSWQEVSKSDKIYPIPGDPDYEKRKNEIIERVNLLERKVRRFIIRRREERTRKLLP